MQGITFGADRLQRAVSFHVDEAVIKSSAQGTSFLVLDVRANLLGDGGRIFADKASDSGFRETVFDSVLDSFSLI